MAANTELQKAKPSTAACDMRFPPFTNSAAVICDFVALTPTVPTGLWRANGQEGFLSHPPHRFGCINHL